MQDFEQLLTIAPNPQGQSQAWDEQCGREPDEQVRDIPRNQEPERGSVACHHSNEETPASQVAGSCLINGEAEEKTI